MVFPAKATIFFPEILFPIKNIDSLTYSRDHDMNTVNEILFSYEPTTPFKKSLGKENWEKLRDLVIQQVLEN